MSLQSAFQCLPLHIAETIAAYYVSPYECNGFAKPTARSRAWATLYNVSHSWRVLALQFFLNEVTLNINQNGGPGHLKYHNKPSNVNVGFRHYSYVKAVVIQITMKTPLTEEGLINSFIAAWPEGSVFPFARLLKIELSGLLIHKSDNYNNIKNSLFSTLYQRIQLAMPRIQEISIIGDNRWRIIELLSVPFGNTKSISTNSSKIQLTSNFYLPAADIGLLTRLNCGPSCNDAAFCQVIRKSALTLESLEFYESPSLDLTAIVLAEKNNIVAYPRLQKLCAFGYNIPDAKDKIKVDRSFTPFPVLKYLRWSAVYTFEDDTLFRGNNTTLEYLDIKLDTELAYILDRYIIFSGGKYPQLRHASLWKIGSSELFVPERDSFERLAISTIGPATEYFSCNTSRLKYINDAMAKTPYVKGIKVLNLSGFKGTLRNLLDIIQHLPNMTKLECSVDNVNYDPGNEQFKNSIDNYCKKLYPLSKSLRCWEVQIRSRDSANFVALSALALAILYPNFEWTRVSPGHRKECRRSIKNVVECGLFDNHIDRIKYIF